MSASTTEKSKVQDNPLFEASGLPLDVPDFSRIKEQHYWPAFREGMKIQLEEIKKIAGNKSAPTFVNTIVAMELSGELLSRVSRVFFNMASAHTNEKIQEIQSEMAPKLAAHSDNILLNRDLFTRVDTLYTNRDNLGLDDASLKLLKDTHRDFIRAGARLAEKDQARMREINERISSLTTKYQENLLKMTRERAVILDDVQLLDGLPSDKIAAAKKAAEKRGLDDKFLLQISNTTRVPLLSGLKNREVRKQLWQASAGRGKGQNNGIDNRPIVLELVKLRAERAGLLGYQNYASYALEPETAKTPETALEMLTGLIPAVTKNTAKEANHIAKMMENEGINDELQPWDWEYYSEKVRKAEYDIDETDVRPYFELNRVLKDGVFYVMNQLYGITFEERDDLPVYHQDVRVFDVFDDDGTQLGLFYADFFARDSKRGGAWMSSFAVQSRLKNEKPVISNVLNIAPPAEGEPALLSFRNVTTMFHEMGHAVHGLLSDVEYPSQSGTSVPRDFVEFPSTFEEDWAIHPQVLKNYAVHYQTGEKIPGELLKKLIDARNFNQGFDTQEYLAAAIIDLEWHLLEGNEHPYKVEQFEKNVLAKYNLDWEVVPPRYKSAYFSHIFSGGYSAHYYAYIWSEILAADAFAFMSENGGLKRSNGNRIREHILSQGGSLDAMQLYQNYRGKDPDVHHLLIRRGLK